MAHSTENIIIITSYVDAPFDMKQALTQMKDPYIICTDGGFDLAKQAGITPHLLLGDLDSIQSRIPKELPLKTFPPEKDYTEPLFRSQCKGHSEKHHDPPGKRLLSFTFFSF